MIDSHCHLDACEDPELAVDADLRAIVTVGTGVESSLAVLELATRHPNVWVATGVHPNEASTADEAGVRERIEAIALDERVVAIGETGFDDHWQDETLDTQARSFHWQADLARRLNKALIVHVRDAAGDDAASRAAIAALRSAGHTRGVLHCCNGHPELIDTGLELGWYVSFAGNLTYPSAGLLREAAARVPLDRLLVETDSPYLAPVPKRGRRNTPAYVRHTAAALAELRKLEFAALEAATDANATALYGLRPT